MIATLNYKGCTVCDYSALVDKGFDLASPFRSTVPLLAYWVDTEARLAEVAQRLKLSLECDITVDFEHKVKPPQGKGTASHTDLMVLARQCQIGMEAKYTEQKYQTVSKWLGDPVSENKKLVLQGWLGLINKVAGCSLTKEQVQGFPYQLIHRTASACKGEADHRAVVYHYFDAVQGRLEYYLYQLQALNRLVAAPDHLSFFLYVTMILKTTAYGQLQAEWLRQGKPDFSAEVHKLLIDRNVAAFSDPVVWSC